MISSIGRIKENINEIEATNVSDESKEIIIENNWVIFANAIVNLDEVSAVNYMEYERVVFHLKTIGKTNEIICSRESYIKIANILKKERKKNIL